MNIKDLFEEIIPPNDYTHREGFANIQILEKLTENERIQIENMLIERLSIDKNFEIDTLVVETLGYLKSKEAVPSLKRLLGETRTNFAKLVIAVSIYEIGNDEDMISFVKKIFKEIEIVGDSSHLIHAFFYLIKLNDQGLNKMIKAYENHRDYLVAYNAKRALALK